ncbi:contractile injection system protein, VgrG/Pvc8 family [Aquisalimonas sp.]|uniref:contractile injection system protein, VgrG/Pvc8 family n=1 Tax=Aquisalimonas sp. TaxID=1872621 RepID=UPI0025BD64B9|nr:contractile injection system protein, VgrG/Pvc8 family [Aquisalimonas sp.]
MADTPWSRPWGRVWLGQTAFPVKRLDVREWVSSPFRAWAYVVVGKGEQAPARTDIIGQPAHLEWGNGDWGRRCRGGVVTWLRGGDCAQTGRRYFELTIEPRLTQLARGRATRLFTAVEHRELVAHLLHRAGYPAPAMDWRGDTLERRRHLLQAEESDLDLLQRVLARAGVCYAWGDGAEECIRFVEDPRDFPLHAQTAVLSPQSVAPGAHGFDRHAFVRQLAVPPTAPVAPRMREDAQRLRTVRRQRADAATCRLKASGPRADLTAGDRLKVASDDGPDVPYLLVHTHHRLNLDRSGEQVPGGFQLSLEAVPEWDDGQERIYRPPEPPKVARPLAMSAEIVSRSTRGPEAFPGGGARLRLAQDEQPSGELPRVTAFNGRGSSSGAGWYTPLADGNRVLVSCLEHDPDAPVILGVLPTARNRQQAARTKGRDGAWVSAAGQGLTVTSAGVRVPEQTHLTLHSPGADNCLQFRVEDERVSELVRLASEKGLLNLECGGDLLERTGGDRRDDVAGDDTLTVNESVTVAGEAGVYVRAAQSINLTGGSGVRVASGGALQLRAAKGATLRGAAGTRVRLSGGDGVWQTLGGDLQLQAAGPIRLRSHRGTITLTNASRSAGLSVDSGGRTALWGGDVTLRANGSLVMQGDVDYNTGGPIPVEPVVVKPSECAGLTKVAVEGAMDIEPTEW